MLGCAVAEACAGIADQLQSGFHCAPARKEVRANLFARPSSTYRRGINRRLCCCSSPLGFFFFQSQGAQLRRLRIRRGPLAFDHLLDLSIALLGRRKKLLGTIACGVALGR